MCRCLAGAAISPQFVTIRSGQNVSHNTFSSYPHHPGPRQPGDRGLSHPTRRQRLLSRGSPSAYGRKLHYTGRQSTANKLVAASSYPFANGTINARPISYDSRRRTEPYAANRSDYRKRIFS
jgi:hypothetical protein